jgi:hypothetical protein
MILMTGCHVGIGISQGQAGNHLMPAAAAVV